MHFSEDDLQKALKRKDPGQGFTQRTLIRVNQARVNQAQAEGKDTSQAKTNKPNGSAMAWWNLRPAWTIALVVILLLAVGVGGYQYSEYRHAEEMKIAREKNEKLQREAEKARDEAIMALEIARNKLNHVLQHAQLPMDRDEKIRRQRL